MSELTLRENRSRNLLNTRGNWGRERRISSLKVSRLVDCPTGDTSCKTDTEIWPIQSPFSARHIFTKAFPKASFSLLPVSRERKSGKEESNGSLPLQTRLFLWEEERRVFPHENR